MKTRKEKLLALAFDRGATPEGQLAALRYLALCDEWQDVQRVAATRWWERPECGDGYVTFSGGCEVVKDLKDGIPYPGDAMIRDFVFASPEDAAADMRDRYRDDDESIREHALSYVVTRVRTTPGAGGLVCYVCLEIVRPNCRALIAA